MLFPSVRAGEQHAHMMPALYKHLKENNCENQPDKFGRMNAMFYRNWVRQENTRKYPMFDQWEKHFWEIKSSSNLRPTWETLTTGGEADSILSI